MATMVGRNCRVFIGDVEISHMVAGLSIDAPVNGVVVANVEFMCGISFVDGRLRLDGGPLRTGPMACQDTAPLKIRAMQLTGDIVGT